jgi:hypothetical protein
MDLVDGQGSQRETKFTGDIGRWQPLGDGRRHGGLYSPSTQYSFLHGSKPGRWKSCGAFVWSCRSFNDSKSSAYGGGTSRHLCARPMANDPLPQEAKLTHTHKVLRWVCLRHPQFLIFTSLSSKQNTYCKTLHATSPSFDDSSMTDLEYG